MKNSGTNPLTELNSTLSHINQQRRFRAYVEAELTEMNNLLKKMDEKLREPETKVHLHLNGVAVPEVTCGAIDGEYLALVFKFNDEDDFPKLLHKKWCEKDPFEA